MGTLWISSRRGRERFTKTANGPTFLPVGGGGETGGAKTNQEHSL